MHRSVRLAAPAAAAIAALLLSGCAGDNGNDEAAEAGGEDTAQPRDDGAGESAEPAGDDAAGDDAAGDSGGALAAGVPGQAGEVHRHGFPGLPLGRSGPAPATGGRVPGGV
ncbi:hypothetical protein FOE67_16935, partial [Streptomyces calidiresistens]|nr:hypothetical protein [Streptomyces calidiresistens]